MLEAYKLQSVLKSVQIESIAAYDNNVILGTRSGQLIMYSVSDSGSVDMLMFNKNFSKKAITQMEVITAEKLLFVLTDNTINVCDINQIEKNFSFIHSSLLTKGCTLFAKDVKTTILDSGEVVTVIRICCVIKRTLQFFYWKVNFLETQRYSIELKDIPKALCWVDDVMCVGFKDEYVMYSLSNPPQKHDLIVTSSSHSVDPCICLLKNNILGFSKDDYLVAIDPSDYITKEDGKIQIQGSLDPSMVAAGGKNNIFKPILWSSRLMGLVWDEPYAIGRVANAIEVRSLDGNEINKETLVQSIPELGKTKFLVRSGKGTIFAAATSELWCIRLADIPTQRQQLIQQKRYKLAIELTSVSSEPEEIKAETIRQIHMRYARELFSNKQFEAAMTEFTSATADPYDVIRLFPNLLQDQSKTFIEGDVPVPAAPPMPQLEDKDLENAIIALIGFLVLARQKEVVKLRDQKSNSKSLLSIIDTTLLKCYLQTNDSLIAPLLRLNQCHFEESEKTLKKHDKISELIILYQTNGKHKKALELLQAQATIENSSLYGHDRTIRYLQQLGSTYLPLIFEFSDWVLKEHPEDGLRIFTENLIEVESLPRINVLDFLISKHKNFVIPYLEHIINEWNETNSFMHNVLIKKYREHVQSLMEELKDKELTDEKSEKISEELKDYRNKLYNILKNSKNYSPDAALKELPTNILFEERALILGRLKKHEEVLKVYVKILGDIDAAAEYCEKNYDDNDEIFLTLVKIILNVIEKPSYEGVEFHEKFKESNIEVALDIINKYAIKLDPCELMPFLPDDLPAYRVADYLDTVLRHQMAEEHQESVMMHLLDAEIKRGRELIRRFQSQYVEITEFTVCPDCQKRFAAQSPFVRYPNGEVVHLSCHEKRAEKAQSQASTSGNASQT